MENLELGKGPRIEKQCKSPSNGLAIPEAHSSLMFFVLERSSSGQSDDPEPENKFT